MSQSADYDAPAQGVYQCCEHCEGSADEPCWFARQDEETPGHIEPCEHGCNACRCRIIGWSRDPYEPHIPTQAEWEQADDCPVHPRVISPGEDTP